MSKEGRVEDPGGKNQILPHDSRAAALIHFMYQRGGITTPIGSVNESTRVPEECARAGRPNVPGK